MPEQETFEVKCVDCGEKLHDCGYVSTHETNPDYLPISNHDERGHHCDKCFDGPVTPWTKRATPT